MYVDNHTVKNTAFVSYYEICNRIRTIPTEATYGTNSGRSRVHSIFTIVDLKARITL